MIRPRDLGYLAGAVVAAPFLGWRLWRTGKWRTDWGERFGRTRPLPPGPRTLLLHGVSLGEINATRSLVDALRRSDPDLQIVISATTDSGIARARTLYGGGHPVVRFPFDVSPAVGSFLDAVAPDVVALMELELWPTFTDECRRRGIPVAVVNGRLSERSFGRYRRIRPLVARMFGRVALAAVQTRDYGDRFAALGTPPERVRVVDNLKWEVAVAGDGEDPGRQGGAGRPGQSGPPGDGATRVSDAESHRRPAPGSPPATLAAALGIDPDRPLVVAGSTAAGEEPLVLEGLPADAQVLLAPRRPERFDEVAALFPGVVRRTLHPDGTVRSPDPATRVFLLDTLGELRNAYALADVVVVGRSFMHAGMGGSDPIEAAALGKPVIIGPDHGNFSDVVAAFQEQGGIVVANHPGRAAAELLANPALRGELASRAVEVIRTRRGAAKRTAEALLELV